MRPQRTDFPSPETPRTKFAPAASVSEPAQRGSTPSPINPGTLSPLRHPLTPAGTEDSDTDFQSAYSTSPRGFDDETNSMDGITNDVDIPPSTNDTSVSPPASVAQKPSILKDMGSWTRTRASSTATTATAIPRSPTVTDSTVASDAQPSSRHHTASKAKGQLAQAIDA